MGGDNTTRLLGISAAVATGIAATYYGYEQISKRLPKYKQQCELLHEYEASLLPPREAIQTLEDDIVKQMKLALEKPNGSSVLMLPTYINQMPTGEEQGSCYALDIGGTNFRTAYYKLSEKHGQIDEVAMRQVAIPEWVYTGSSNDLFDFMAAALKDFIQEQEQQQQAASGQAAAAAAAGGAPAKDPVVGFCFSFAVVQEALNHGKLIHWTKGFDVKGVPGKDVVGLLSDALVRAGRPCRVLALINDSVGVLTASRYFDQSTGLGVILGTGTNACIVEKVSNIPKWKPAGVSGDALTAINTEWGCYCSDLLPRCQEDLDLDEASGPQKGKMQIEKLMSGLYLGEVARRILLTFAQKVELFGPSVPPLLSQPGTFSTACLSEVESDLSPLKGRVCKVLKEGLGVDCNQLNCETLYMVQAICRLVVRRSARTAAALLLATLQLQGWFESPRRMVIAVDGGVVLKYQNWRRFLDEYLRELLGARARELAPFIVFRPTADGSSFGAAVIAAAAAAAADGSS